MDPTPIVDGVIQVVQSNPKTAGFLALIPVTQIVAALLLKVKPIKSTHPTILNRALSWWARWPGPSGQ